MEEIYNVVQQSLGYYSWVFSIITVLAGFLVYRNKQSHDRKMAEINHTPWVRMHAELEKLAGETKEIITGYKATSQKQELLSSIFIQLDQFAGWYAKYPSLMQVIRNFNQYCKIMLDSELNKDEIHESYRSDIIKSYNGLVKELEKTKRW